MATSESAEEQYYTGLGLSFVVYRVLTKEEGRKIILDASQELLNEINSIAELQPFLRPSPFTIDSIGIDIYAHHPNGSLTFFPDIRVFSARSGEIEYLTKVPEKPYGFYTEENESYEEALELVRTRNNT